MKGLSKDGYAEAPPVSPCPPGSKSQEWKLWLFRLAAVFIAFLVSLLLGEILVRIVAPQNLIGTWFEQSPRGTDINKANWTSHQQFGNRTVTYRINNFHLRGGPIGRATYRILCVGDSFTFGWLLDETNTFVAELGRHANHDFPNGTFEFLNGGMGGSGTADYVAFVEDFGVQIHPAAVVVFLNNDDVERSVRSGLFTLDSNKEGAVIPLKANVPGTRLRNFFRSFRLYQWALEHSQLIQLLRVTVQTRFYQTEKAKSMHHATDAVVESHVHLTQALFLRLQQWCLGHSCRLFVVTTGFHAFSDFPLGHNDGADNDEFFAEAPQFFSKSKINFYDIGPKMFERTKGDYSTVVIANDYHPNEQGSELIATFAWQWLEPQFQLMLSPTNGSGTAR